MWGRGSGPVGDQPEPVEQDDSTAGAKRPVEDGGQAAIPAQPRHVGQRDVGDASGLLLVPRNIDRSHRSIVALTPVPLE